MPYIQNPSRWMFVLVKWPEEKPGLMFGICRVHHRTQFRHPIYLVGPTLGGLKLGSYQHIHCTELKHKVYYCLIVATGNYETCSIGFNHVCQAYKKHGEMLFWEASPFYYFKCGTRKRSVQFQ